MPTTADYQVVAKRALLAAKLLKSQVHEKKAFLAYHAFESTGCALSILHGLAVGQDVSHLKKLHHFADAASARCGRKLALEITKLVISVSALRNRLLYPEDHAGGAHTHLPQHRLTVKQAQQLYDRIEKVVTQIDALCKPRVARVK
jgi:hypothetical protein